MTRRRGETGGSKLIEPEGFSHYAGVFDALANQAKAHAAMEQATSPAMRGRQRKKLVEASKKLFEANDRLEALMALTSRESVRGMTRLVAAFRRRGPPQLDAEGEMKRWLRGGQDDFGSYKAFIDWCTDQRLALHELKQHRALTTEEGLTWLQRKCSRRTRRRS
jgi:hypothetical protein